MVLRVVACSPTTIVEPVRLASRRHDKFAVEKLVALTGTAPARRMNSPFPQQVLCVSLCRLQAHFQLELGLITHKYRGRVAQALSPCML